MKPHGRSLAASSASFFLFLHWRAYRTISDLDGPRTREFVAKVRAGSFLHCLVAYHRLLSKTVSSGFLKISFLIQHTHFLLLDVMEFDCLESFYAVWFFESFAKGAAERAEAITTPGRK